MDSRIQNEYYPDHVTPPGWTLSDKLEELNMSQAELARRMGRHRKTINEITQGKAPITLETALQLEAVLSIPAGFWNRRELQYRQYRARQARLEELGGHLAWMEQFPVRDMARLDWIQQFSDAAQQVAELLNFFGVSSPTQWDTVWKGQWVAYRKTDAYESGDGSLSAWLRKGEIEAHRIHCQPYSATEFRKALTGIRLLTTEPTQVFVPEMVGRCAAAGVAVVFVPQLPQAKVSGATCWLAPDKAVIQLSLRYKSDDHLWFTFFHEAGHILLHGKTLGFLEDCQENDTEKQQANDFAANMLIPPDALKHFLATKMPVRISRADVTQFAQAVGIAPGIVVGRLQHDGHLEFSHLNDLKQKLVWGSSRQ